MKLFEITETNNAIYRIYTSRSMKKYDIFISYRREGGFDLALQLYHLLTRDGYRVSFDIDTLRGGDFDTQLYERIDNCKDFILIVDEHAFDRTIIDEIPREEDWLRCELARALEKKKNIIPVFLFGVQDFPKLLKNKSKDKSEDKFEDISGVVKKNGLKYNPYYFDEFYRKLKERFLHKRRTIWKKKLVTIVAGCIVCSSALVIILLSKGNNDTGTDKVVTKAEEKICERPTDKDITSTPSANSVESISSKTPLSHTQEKSERTTEMSAPPTGHKQNTNELQKATTTKSSIITSKPIPSTTSNQTLRIYDIDELMKLAASGDARAYIPLAKYYYDNACGISSYERVHQYAMKAIKANVDVNEAQKLINNIENLGFYDYSNYKKPNF